MKAIFVLLGLYICVARSSWSIDPCVFHHPEEGRGHVAYSRTQSFFDLARSAMDECESIHGECEIAYCFDSRQEVEPTAESGN